MRISAAFDTAIHSLRNENDKTINKDCKDASLQLLNEFQTLKEQVSDLLSYTFDEEQVLRSETLRYNVEASSKSEELAKLKRRLSTAREERKERRDELESELSELKTVLQEKIAVLRKEQDEVIVTNAEREQSEMKLFEEEMSAMEKQRDGLRKQLQEQKHANAYLESKLRDANAIIALELKQAVSDNSVAISKRAADIGLIKETLGKQQKRRTELEEHFVRVDANNAAKKKEEEALERVAEISRKAQELLDAGASQLQRLFRGMRDRAIVEKMKKASKKKGKMGKGKKK